MDNLAILYTTFMRDDLMNETITSIADNWMPNYHVLISDQTATIERDRFIDNVFRKIHAYNNFTPLMHKFDCGLSGARNALVNVAHQKGFKYCLLTADSLKFIDKYDYQPIIDFLESNPNYGIVGLDIPNRKGDWTRDIDLIPGECFHLTFPKNKPIEFDGINFQPCGIVKNFFIAKIECLLENPWDEELPLCVGEDTPILIKDGWGNIKSIFIQDLFPESVTQSSFSAFGTVEIWSGKGWTKIKKISRRKPSEDVLEISSNSGYIQTTCDHRFMIDNNEIEAKDLTRIETINFPKLENILSINDDLAWMLGFFLAEGTIKTHKGHRIEIANQNMDYLQRCEKAFNSIGIECAWYDNKLKRKDKCAFLRIKTPKVLSSYFNQFELNGNKTIPPFVFKFDKNSRIKFLEGVFCGDGTKGIKSPRIYAQKSASIINGLLYLLSDIHKDYYIAKRSNQLGSWFTLHSKFHYKNENSDEIRIKQKIKYDKLVYDIETENHHFCGGIGNINLHNCEHESFFYELTKTKWKVFFTKHIAAEYLEVRPAEYNNYRKRMYSIYRRKLQEKYNIKGWVRLER